MIEKMLIGILRINPFPLNKLIKTQLSIAPGLKLIQLFSWSTQHSTKVIILINAKMPKIVGILTCISMINTTFEIFESINSLHVHTYPPWEDPITSGGKSVRPSISYVYDLVSCVRCGAWLYLFLIFALFLTLRNLINWLLSSADKLC